MRDRRSALLWAVAWWFARRWLRRRAAVAVAGITAGATVRRGRLRSVLGVILIVGVLAAAFVAWRKLVGRTDASDAVSPSPAPVGAGVPDGSAAAAGAAT